MGIIGDEPAGARLQDQSYRDASNWIGMVDGSGETQAGLWRRGSTVTQKRDRLLFAWWVVVAGEVGVMRKGSQSPFCLWCLKD